ncbi:MAG: radical SAM protein [candidate division Zixibacteria bacterium]|jgi:radical SAM protein with 4Fe4S-binding SPASM domain|nr:radical SAM protein [candidate division Zixibacteria bacterium]
MSEFQFYPQAVVWEITFACNMRCLHCGTAAGKKRPDELTTDEALALIDELCALGAVDITLSGGEPLLRTDWPLLAKRINDNGAKPYLITNGMAVTPEIVDTFVDVGLRNVGVSFDGVKKTHNFIRQREDSYDRVINAFHLMAANPRLKKFCALSQISNINLDEMETIRDILIDSGVPQWRIQMTTATGRMREHGNLVMSIENFPRFVDKILELKQDKRLDIDVGENIGYYGCKGTMLTDGHPYWGCFAGTRGLGIESNGDIKGCLSMPEQFVEGNIRTRSLTEIWNDPDAFAYNRKFKRESAGGFCKQCKYLPMCRAGCATTAVSASGSRGDNPYCIYRIEHGQGLHCQDNELITNLLTAVYRQIGEEMPAQ